MPNTKTVEVPHLDGITAAYQMRKPYDPKKPTVVLVNCFSLTSDLYDDQFNDSKLMETMNLIAIEPLGHGQTRTKSDSFTYWDTAHMNWQVLDALNIKGKIFAVGTSQGGWIIVQMYLLRPDRVAGLLPLGTSMDYESDRSRTNGNFDAYATLGGPLLEFTSEEATPDFVMPKDFRDKPIYVGFGLDVDDKTVQFWDQELRNNYSGDDGRRRLREIILNLLTRDGLHERLIKVRCPVWWLHGSSDLAFSVKNAQEEIKLFVNSPDAQVQVLEGGSHYLSASKPEAVNKALFELVTKYS